ncbi:MAG: ABC transporter ATP-binding protein [Firmicutes bacterium]|nr:ABC transporter ATP-binding protein [Bacillota bacterium]
MSEKLLEVKDLKVYFEMKKGLASSLFGKPEILKAVDGVSFTIDKGEILSLVGESGSGKTTTGKAILQLIPEARGSVLFEGEELIGKKDLTEFRKKAQMIYQDPYQALNPRQFISDIVGEPLEVNGMDLSIDERNDMVREALESASLTPADEYWFRRPFELSGGQRQRAAIAGSLILKPELVVADEPVSMLDASIRTGIIDMMLKERDKKGVAYLFITHDLSLAWLISDKIAIMYLGKIMEIGTANEIVHHAAHPYSKALLNIMPIPGKILTGKRQILEGETPNASEDIKGCKFCGRCPLAEERCFKEAPEYTEVSPGHLVYCHKVKEGKTVE